MPDRFEEPSHDAVPTFAQHRAVPAVCPGTAAFLERLDAGHAVLQGDPALEHGLLLRREFAPGPHGILPVELETGVGEAVCQVARRSEEEQSAGIEVEPADVEPSTSPHRRQVVEDAGAPLRIVAAHDLAFGLVIDQHPWQCALSVVELTTVEADAIARPNAGPEGGRATIDGEPPATDEVLHVAARTEPERREHLLQPLGRDGCGYRTSGARWPLPAP
jgi:hypothetical protein